jgi:quercetin dioxygenase-like cupin family protein
MSENEMKYPPIPPDDHTRKLTFAQPECDGELTHIGLVGDTYTVTVSGKDADNRFCVIDMHVPPGGGPGPHRHNYEETFVVLDGEIEATFRGDVLTVRAGETIHIPANAPHHFHNASSQPARLLCICAPAGIENFFMAVGVPVATRTSPPPHLSEPETAEFIQKARALAPQYHTEVL